MTVGLAPGTSNRDYSMIPTVDQKSVNFNLMSFGIFCDRLIYCSRFGMLYEEKSGNIGLQQKQSTKNVCN
jgi:hypothetical protein